MWNREIPLPSLYWRRTSFPSVKPPFSLTLSLFYWPPPFNTRFCKKTVDLIHFFYVTLCNETGLVYFSNSLTLLWQGMGDSSRWELQQPFDVCSAGSLVKLCWIAHSLSNSVGLKWTYEVLELVAGWMLYCNILSQITSSCSPCPCYKIEQYLVEELWSGVRHPHDSLEFPDALTEVNA